MDNPDIPLTFQQEIDVALKAVGDEGTFAESTVHSIPVGEVGHRAQIHRALREREAPTTSPRVHIGVAGFFNLEVAAQAKSDYMLLLDNNKNQRLFWEEVIFMLRNNSTPERFIEAWKRAVPKGDLMYLGAGHSIELRDTAPRSNSPASLDQAGAVLDYFKRASWLHDEGAYQHLHTLAKEKKIATATIDLVDGKQSSLAIGSCLSRLGLHADTCYWSNVASYFAPHRGYDETTSRDDSVFGNEDVGGAPLLYEEVGHYADDRQGMTRWSGDEANEGLLTPSDMLPAFERILRNVSAISAGEGMHMLAHATKADPSCIITDGAPRNLAYITRRRLEIATRGDEGVDGV